MKRCNEQRICETCGLEYTAKVVTARFCSPKCMHAWRTELAWEKAVCLACGKEFERRKRERSSRDGQPRRYCSVVCATQSSWKRDVLRKWALSDNNHWNDPNVQAKVKITKKERYGDANYNNLSKHKETCLERYGVLYGVLVAPKSNGKRISKVQRNVYEQIRQQYPDALLEHWLPDVRKSVDVFVPSLNRIIEVFGTYWHCDPRKYNGTFFNQSLKMTAEKVWKRDADRIKHLQAAGYEVDVVWEREGGWTLAA